MTSDSGFDRDVLVVGGGVAGLSAAVFTARAGLDTLVIDSGGRSPSGGGTASGDGSGSILARNAHLENVPGFPAGINPRTFLDLLAEQADRNGVERRDGRVESLDCASEAGFLATLADGDDCGARQVIAASWADSDYLDGLGVESRSAGSKQFIQPDADGRTNVEGLYAAGRLAEQYHQAVVAAGHGAQVAITLIHDSDRPFYHDWVAPEGYFTDRGREVPPGCEEIGEGERRARERESMETMRERFADPHPSDQPTHPSLAAEDDD